MSEPRFSAALLLVCAPFVVAGLAACSSSEGEPADPGTGEKTSTFCTSDENTAPEFAMPMVEMGADSRFKVTITDADPIQPVEGRNTWTVKVTDASDVPVEDATLTTRCAMPGHSHDCAVTPDVTNLGGGMYEISPLIFNMSKNWTVTFTVKSGTATDSAKFGVCI